MFVYLAAVEAVIDQCLKPLSDACTAKHKSDDYTPEQFRVIAFHVFEALTKKPKMAINVTDVVSMDDEDTYQLSTYNIGSVLNHLVLLNLITFPSVVKPNTIEWCHRSLHHAWVKVRVDERLVRSIDKAKRVLVE